MGAAALLGVDGGRCLVMLVVVRGGEGGCSSRYGERSWWCTG
jgi:hypothetical protein